MRCLEDHQKDYVGDDENYYSLYHYETDGFLTIEVIDSGIGISEEG